MTARGASTRVPRLVTPGAFRHGREVARILLLGLAGWLALVALGLTVYFAVGAGW